VNLADLEATIPAYRNFAEKSTGAAETAAALWVAGKKKKKKYFCFCGRQEVHQL